ASARELAEMVRRHTPPSEGVPASRATWLLVPQKFGRIMTYLTRRYAVEPDYDTDLDPAALVVYAIEPADVPTHEPADRMGERRAILGTNAWLALHHFGLSPPLETVPNKDPRAKAPWSLHRAVPLAPPSSTAPAGGGVTAP